MTNRLFSCTIAASLLGTLPIPASAQDGTGRGIEEIIVTAQKREESLQDTPISLVALSGRELETRQINGLNDLRSSVPNLQLTPHPNSAATTQVFMRGVGLNDDQITQDPSTAIYIDGVYVARSQGLAMDVADLERVEVLRGPQGTLYGRNATGGAINFITRRPAPGEFGGKLQGSIGNYDYFRLKGSVNIPLADTLTAGLSYLHAKKDGYVKNRGIGVSRFGDQDRTAYRADVLWEPAQNVSLRYGYDRSEIEDTPAYITRAPFHPAKARRPKSGAPTVAGLLANDVVSQGHSLTVEWNATDDLTVRSITSYRKLDNFQNQDYLSGALRPQALQRNRSLTRQDQTSQELQLIGSLFGGSLEYVAGAYYFKEDGIYRAANLPTTGTSTGYTDASIDNKSSALFGQFTWTPAGMERLHLTLGSRHSRDKRAATLATSTRNGTGPIVPISSGAGSRVFTDSSPTFVIAYDATDNVNIYAKAVKGYKTGGFNTRASSITRFNAGFAEETLWSYELGLKSQLLDNRVRFNIAAFTSKYRDIQVNVQSDPANIRLTDVLNAGRATVEGIEADLTVAPFDGLLLTANYGYLDAGYDRIIDATGADVAHQFRFINAPQHSYALDATYTSPELGFGSIEANLNYSWQDQRYSASNIAGGAYIIDSYGLLNARLGLVDIPVAKGLRIGVFGRNLLDRKYYIAHFNVGVPGAIFGEQRTYGIDLIAEF